MTEARQTLDPVLLIEVVSGPDCVAVQKQHFRDRLTAHSLLQQQQRIRAAGQAVLGGTVAGQINQVASRGLPRSWVYYTSRPNSSTLGGPRIAGLFNEIETVAKSSIFKAVGISHRLERSPVMLQHILRERRSWRRLWRTTVARTVRHGGEVPVQCARHTCAGMP